jgi:hypothetical protein
MPLAWFIWKNWANPRQIGTIGCRLEIPFAIERNRLML